MNIYELTNEFLKLQQLIEDPETDAEEITKQMDSIEGAIEWKADGYAMVIKNIEGSLASIKTEMDRLYNRKTLLELGVKRLKQNLQMCMVLSGKTKFKTDLFNFSIQKNGGALPVIVDVETSELPDDLVIVQEKPDLKAIEKYIKETGDLTYAHFGDRGESLRIK